MIELSRAPVIDLLTELARRPEAEMQDTIAALIAVYHRATDPEEAREACDAAGKEVRMMWLECDDLIPADYTDPAWRTR